MISPSGNIQQNYLLERSSGDRLNGNRSEQEGGNLHVPSTTPSSNSGECEVSRIEQVKTSLHLPTEEVHNTAVLQIPGLQISRGLHCAMATNSTLVPCALPNIRRPLTSTHSARTIGSIKRSFKWLLKLRMLGRVQFLKHIYSATRGAKVANSLIHAFRKSSINQTETALRVFQSWLPNSVTVLRKRYVLEFLVFLRDQELFSTHTAQFHLSPPLQKKLTKWSLNHALKTLQTPRFRNTSTSPEDLFLKTIFLVAIASGNRCSELAACTREGISFEDNRVLIPTKDGFYSRTKRSTKLPFLLPSPPSQLNINFAQPSLYPPISKALFVSQEYTFCPS